METAPRAVWIEDDVDIRVELVGGAKQQSSVVAIVGIDHDGAGTSVVEGLSPGRVGEHQVADSRNRCRAGERVRAGDGHRAPRGRQRTGPGNVIGERRRRRDIDLTVIDDLAIGTKRTSRGDFQNRVGVDDRAIGGPVGSTEGIGSVAGEGDRTGAGDQIVDRLSATEFVDEGSVVGDVRAGEGSGRAVGAELERGTRCNERGSGEGIRRGEDECSATVLCQRACSRDQVGDDRRVAAGEGQHRVVGHGTRSEGPVGSVGADLERAAADGRDAVAVATGEHLGAASALHQTTGSGDGASEGGAVGIGHGQVTGTEGNITAESTAACQGGDRVVIAVQVEDHSDDIGEGERRV